jgi:hypothetical protein
LIIPFLGFSEKIRTAEKKEITKKLLLYPEYKGNSAKIFSNGLRGKF